MAASFVDTARHHRKAGNGGNGAVASTGKIWAAGGPDGGDGGRGGNVVLVVDDEYVQFLMDFRYKLQIHRPPTVWDLAPALQERQDGGDWSSVCPGAPWYATPRPTRSFTICPMQSPFVLAWAAGRRGGNQHFATPHPPGAPLRQQGMTGESQT